jgi:hypothetical protein
VERKCYWIEKQYVLKQYKLQAGFLLKAEDG